MKFLEYLTEKYYDLVSFTFFGKKESYPIFINPTSSEIKELPDNTRFVVDSKKKEVYVWDSQMIHSYALPHLLIDAPSSLTGTAKKLAGKLVMIYSDQMNYMLTRADPTRAFPSDIFARKYILDRSWIWEKNNKWANKYINIDSWINKKRDVFDKIKKEYEEDVR